MALNYLLYALVAIVTTRRTLAQLQPTTPGPNETYTAGSPCNIAWNVDKSGEWTNVTVGKLLVTELRQISADCNLDVRPHVGFQYQHESGDKCRNRP